MFGNAPLISYILPKPIGSKSFPPNSTLYPTLSAEVVLAMGLGAKAVADPTTAARRGSFMLLRNESGSEDLPQVREQTNNLPPILYPNTMRFSKSTVMAVALLVAAVDAFAPTHNIQRRHIVVRSSQQQFSTTNAEAVPTESRPPTKKEKRLEYIKSPTFHRQGFKEVRDNVEKSMGEQFKSGLVDELKSNDYVITKDGVTVHLAKDFGFCWGVERSIALAYEAVEHFPNKKVHITNELIHNPEVNDRLHDMNVQFIEKVNDSTKDFSTVGDGDVVILPAFGASFEEMSLLHSKNVDIVDTTCPWVSKVWNTVDKHQKEGLTSIIHGKYAHEETVATVSFCEEYICVKDMKEAEMVADYIVNGGDKTQFLTYFEKAVSKGFDPDTMLRKVGLANQTTMYKKETRAIGQMMQKAMMKKYGPVDAKDHYQEFDTICDATQVRVSGMGRGNIK